MRGFLNLGNTCYFNSVVQCLLHIPVLSNYFLKTNYKGDCEFTKLYQTLVKFYWVSEEKGCINLKPLMREFFKHFPRFDNADPQDAQEAILCIIDILVRSSPIIKSWFYGKKTQETVWPGGKTSTSEDFSIHITSTNGDNLGEMLNKSTGWNVIENFEDTNGKIHNVATTRMLFSKLPQVLIISLDKKTNISVIEKLLIDKYEYNLIASATHIGNEMDGHYVSFVRREDKWYSANDEFLNEINLLTSGGHYVMVYNLKTPSSEYLL
jgi:ubiquitin C-terminal hydrolase